jgi:hypothetical protein
MSEYDLAWAKFEIFVKDYDLMELRQERIRQEWCRLAKTSTQKKILSSKGHKIVPVRRYV